MPLTQAEMDFFTRHAYELHNFDRPMPAHDYLRSIGTGGPILWKIQVVFQYLWQEQGRDEGVLETFYSWAPPDDLPPLNPPWSTWREFEARAESLYPEYTYRQFESNSHPLRHPNLVTLRKNRFGEGAPEFTPAENAFLDAYYREIFSFRHGPCLTAVREMGIDTDKIHNLISYRATELMQAGMPWPQLDPVDPPIPWSSLDEFKRRFFRPRPDPPRCSYVDFHRQDFSRKERAFFAHYFREVLALTAGPAHEYLSSEGIPPSHLLPFHHNLFSFNGGSWAEVSFKEPLPPFEVPWSSRSVFYQRAYLFCRYTSEREKFLQAVPEEVRDDLHTKAFSYFLNQPEEEFIEWYLAEREGKTGWYTPATHWLWTNGVYPTTLAVMIHVYHKPSGFWYDVPRAHPLPPFQPAWADKEEFTERLKFFLASNQQFKDDPIAQPDYAPEGYEEKEDGLVEVDPESPGPGFLLGSADDLVTWTTS